jgi:hypothetical protein
VWWKTNHDIDAAQTAIKSYIELTHWAIKKKGLELEILDALDRATALCLHINNKEALKVTITEIFYAIQHYKGVDNGRWCLELFTLLSYVMRSKHSSLIEDKAYREVLALAHTLSEQAARANDYHFAQLFLNKVREGALALKDTPLQRTTETELINTLTNNADFHARHNNALVASNILEDAIALAYQYGYPANADSLKAQLPSLYEQSDKQMKTISASVEISKDKLNDAINTFLEPTTLNECLTRLSYIPSWCPNIAKLKTDFKARPQGLANIFTKVIHGDGINIATIEKDEDKLNYELADKVTQHAAIHGKLILKEAFKRLREQKGLNQETFITFLQTWPQLDPKHIPYLKNAFEKYMSGDYAASLHILIPRLEAIMREFFTQAGITTLSMTRKGYEHKTFSKFLFQPEIKEALGENAHAYYRYLLVDKLGLNLRNRLAHGLLRHEECNETITCLTIHMLLMLTNFTIKHEETPPNKAEST